MPPLFNRRGVLFWLSRSEVNYLLDLIFESLPLGFLKDKCLILMLFSSNRPSNVILHHSYTPVDRFQFSAQEFYAEVEKELIARQVPDLTISRVDFHEGGFFSEKRTYLRLTRERLAFDICAAPFGRVFFFSLRIVEKPRYGWFVLLLFLLSISVIVNLCVYALFVAGRQTFTIVGLIAVAGTVYWFFRPQQTATSSPANADPKIPRKPGKVPNFSTFLLNLPVIGLIYERIRKDSYYRLDTRMMYLTVVKEIVQRKIDLITAVKGVKLMRRHEYDPILGALYKRVPIRPGEENPNE